MKLFRWLTLFFSIVFLPGISLANPSSANSGAPVWLMRVRTRAHRARHHRAHRVKRHHAHPART